MLIRANVAAFVFSLVSVFFEASIARAAENGLPDNWRDKAADVVAWFETSGEGYGKVTPDFDCQGMSAGALQWNVGKGSLWDNVLKAIPEGQFLSSMPNYGVDFRNALMAGRKTSLSFVQGLQTYANKNSCDGNERRAKWSQARGSTFAHEVKVLMTSDDVVRAQRSGMNRKLDSGWAYAKWWAEAARGTGAMPTYLEFLTFTDTLNFNGEWKREANWQKVQQFKAGRSDRAVLNEILNFLGAAPDGQYQRREARKNSELWRNADYSGGKLDLLCFAYLVAKNISKEPAIPFRLNTISRRGAIIFSDGWVNGEQKRFPPP